MTVIVDTGVLYADHDRDAARHEEAVSALEMVYDGEFGQPLISDYIFDEAVTLTLKRSSSHDAARAMGERLRGAGSFPTVYEMHRVTPTVFDDAVSAFERYDDQRLSFTDATTVALARHHDVDTVLAFDDDFDGIVDRTHPPEL